jgi:hypothetical protein
MIWIGLSEQPQWFFRKRNHARGTVTCARKQRHFVIATAGIASLVFLRSVRHEYDAQAAYP